MPPSTSSRRTALKRTDSSVDKLASQLASGLTIANNNGPVEQKRRVASKQSPESQKAASMHLVNSASHALSDLVEKGWKCSAEPTTRATKASGAYPHAAVAATHLSILRRLCPNDVDIERAAMGILGKLCALEMFDAALPALEEMHISICRIMGIQAVRPDRLHLVSLPIPSVPPTDPTLLLLISNYILHAVTVIVRVSFRNYATQATNLLGVQLLDILRNEHTLLSWLPLFAQLPPPHIDYLLTRAYSVLTKSIPSDVGAQALFHIRMHALCHLVYTSAGTIGNPDAYWDQPIRYASSYLKSFLSSPTTSTSQDEAAIMISRAFAQIVDVVDGSSKGRQFMSGKAFTAFCDYWLELSSRIGDLSLVDKITQLSDVASPTSHRSESIELSSSAFNPTQFCAAVIKLTTHLGEHGILSLSSDEVHTLLRAVVAHLSTSEATALDSKVEKGIERLRRTLLKVIEATTAALEVLGSLLITIVDILGLQLTKKPDRTGVNKALDTIFTLSRVQLTLPMSNRYVVSHDTLSRAEKILQATGNALQAHERANFLRCISGSFHNMGGQIYKDGRYGSAISFLDDGCRLGQEALSLYRSEAHLVEDQTLIKAWKQLDTQLYRRWQLLGLCNAKISDRKAAQGAYTQAIKTFPYEETEFLEIDGAGRVHDLFNSSPMFNELGMLIDKVTFQGLCELMLSPEEVSLRRIHEVPAIVGVLLERQVECLRPLYGKSAAKAAMPVLLQDAIELYGKCGMALHQGRMLLKTLSMGYFLGSDAFDRIGKPDVLGARVTQCLKDIKTDTSLVVRVEQYRATSLVWQALHIHRCAHEQQMTRVGDLTSQACDVLRTLIQSESSSKAPVKAAVAKTKTSKAVRPTRRAPAKTPVTPKAKQRKALQDVPLNVVTLDALENKHSFVFDEPETLLDALESLTHVLGFLSLFVLKVQVLDLMRRVAELAGGALIDRHASATIHLAHELVAVGKTKRATKLLNQILPTIKQGVLSNETALLFFLRSAELSAAMENFEQSATYYEEAVIVSGSFQEDKTMQPFQRTLTRIQRVDQVAMAYSVFSKLQMAKCDAAASLNSLLHSLRLWNRAYDALSRLQPTPQQKSAIDDPFQDSPQKASTSPMESDQQPKQTFARRHWTDTVGWRISQGLLTAFFALCRAYTVRGSVREAHFFAQQAEELAQALNAPAMTARALTRKAELELAQGLVGEGYQGLARALEILGEVTGIEIIEIHRLRGQYGDGEEDAQEIFELAQGMLRRLDDTFGAFDGMAFGPSSRRSMGVPDVLVPDLVGKLLRDQIWRLRDTGGPDVETLLESLMSLPATRDAKAEDNALMAKLNLHGMYKRFRSDMFLSSLPESTIALPLATLSSNKAGISSSSDILQSLESTEQLLWDTLQLTYRRGSVIHVREAALRLALIRAFQASLGNMAADSPLITTNLLDTSAALTLRREMDDALLHKFQMIAPQDDMVFPTAEGKRLPRRSLFASPAQSDDEDSDTTSLRGYWKSVQDRYHDRALDLSSLATSRLSSVPANWSVIHMTVSDDRSTLFITRQYGGVDGGHDLAFCVPLKGRRDGDDDEHLTFQDVISEFQDIVTSSNETTKAAVNIKSGDEEARTGWWKERGALDVRMGELLENIEFCWLGAFKTILSKRPDLATDEIVALRASFDRAFQRALQSQDKKTKQKALGHKKVASDYQLPNRVTLDDALMECFSTLSIQCRDEELEDLVYFVLDLYQFHGVPVAIAEIDVDQVVVDLRNALEEHSDRMKRRKAKTSDDGDEHVFLVLDKDIQGLPWENIPILRGRSVSRIPSVEFLLDRIEFAQWRRNAGDANLGAAAARVEDRAVVDPRKGYYILNPSGDLGRTETRFQDWANDMESIGWQGIRGRAPSELQFLNALEHNDLVVYFGHGGGEQYIRSHKIRHLPRCAAVMLWGCSSGFLRDMGNFDRIGSPYNYMLSGCPTLVANLWDVTDRDIDKFSQSVFDKIHLDGEHVRQWTSDSMQGTSVVKAVAQSRDVCKMKYLTGAAPVVYGIPFYL